MKKIKKNITLLAILSLILSSCIKDSNPPIPAYVEVGTIQLTVDSNGSQGAGTYNIKDAWVSADNQLLGINTLPSVRFPVIFDQNLQVHSLKVAAGIEDNGVSNSRVIYPFYQVFKTTANLKAGEVTILNPVIRYDTNVTVIIIEDFEPTGTVFSDDRDGDTSSYMARQSTEVLSGNFSGQILIDSAYLECEVATSVKYSNLQPAATSYPVYLEMDYKTNNHFSVGIIAHYNSTSSQTTYIAGVNPSNKWKKIYFNLTNTIFSAKAPQYSIVIRALKNTAVSEPKIYLDNIKLVHY